MDVKEEMNIQTSPDQPRSPLEPGEVEDLGQSQSNSTAFRVDVSLIPQAESKDAGAFDALDLQVFNQADLEAGVIAQAEQRMEERNQALQAKKWVLVWSFDQAMDRLIVWLIKSFV